jgi:hypothetical protein
MIIACRLVKSAPFSIKWEKRGAEWGGLGIFPHFILSERLPQQISILCQFGHGRPWKQCTEFLDRPDVIGTSRFQGGNLNTEKGRPRVADALNGRLKAA